MPLVLKNLLFTLIVPATVAVYVPLWLVRDRTTTRGGACILAAALVALGAGIYLWCVWEFAAFGRGTPLPVDAPRRLVIRGPYRYVRNPMYIAVLVTIGGWAALFTSGALVRYGLSVGVCLHLFVVLYEEPHLRRTFGDQYDEYCAGVGRWIPGAGRRPAV